MVHWFLFWDAVKCEMMVSPVKGLWFLFSALTRSLQTSLFFSISPAAAVTQTWNESLSPATLVMDTNPWLTYLILLSPLPVVFLSAFPCWDVIRHVENKHAKKKNVYFFILSSQPCVRCGGGYSWRVLFGPRHQRAAEVKDGCDHPAAGGQLAVGARLDQNTLILEEWRWRDLTFVTAFGSVHGSFTHSRCLLSVHHTSVSAPLHHSTSQLPWLFVPPSQPLLHVHLNPINMFWLFFPSCFFPLVCIFSPRFKHVPFPPPQPIGSVLLHSKWRSHAHTFCGEIRWWVWESTDGFFWEGWWWWIGEIRNMKEPVWWRLVQYRLLPRWYWTIHLTFPRVSQQPQCKDLGQEEKMKPCPKSEIKKATRNHLYRFIQK